MKHEKFLYVYILRCSDNSYYTGITNNPKRRLFEHNSAINPDSYTASRRPVEMIYCQRFSNFFLAIEWEKRLKKWSRKKKEALLEENWDLIKIEAACKNSSSHLLWQKDKSSF